ncbi:chemotaxis protein [Gallaecimonas kandeliae]|uniref:chemotaxis protein n=1 Tax=Gallaecimonas kandeliae TaxID=3029055 RepID=UPI0026471C75|nr:chemotaxis protein [Gallaecimonas kandeliae]WKE64579.1 chemotaxis protein [Gallaecimonas kandeliae]
MQSAKPRPPIPLLLLDMVGVLLLGLGLGEHFGDLGLVPPSLRFPHFDIALMAAGALLMLPFISWTLKRALGKARQ